MVATEHARVNALVRASAAGPGRTGLRGASYHVLVPKTPTKIAVDAFIAAELTRMNDHGKGTSWRELGRTYGISHVHAREIAMTGTGAGQRLEATWAERHFGGSVDELRRAAEAWARANGRWETPDMSLADPRGWLNDLALEHVRMRPALEMALDAAMPATFLRAFISKHDGMGRDLGAAQWWNLIQAEWAQEESPPATESPAHQGLRHVAHEEAEAGRAVPEEMLAGLRARFLEEPAEGWRAAIDRERVRYGRELLRGDLAKKRSAADGKRRERDARTPAAPAVATKRRLAR